MTELLERAIARLKTLPNDEQDAIARVDRLQARNHLQQR